MSILMKFESRLLDYISSKMMDDPAHDLSHVLRVVKVAKQLCNQENGIEEVVVPAAYLHDCFLFPKEHPHRSQSSRYAADKAVKFLTEIDYPVKYIKAIEACHRCP